MKDVRLLWLAAAPAALGGLAALLLTAFAPPGNLHRLVVFGDWAGLLLAIGVFLSAMLATALLSLWWGSVWGWRRGSVTRREQAREREQFYGRLHHESKNPLMVLRVALHNIARERLTPTGQGSLRNAYEEVCHLDSLVENLRKVAKVSTQRLEVEDVDVVALVEGAVAAIQDQYVALSSGRKFIPHLDKSFLKTPVVSGDRGLLAQALHNVIENACKYSPTDAPIEIWCLSEGDWVRIKVVDRGCGIADKDLRQLGQELFRSAATAASVPGCGLGLAMVRTILDRHGGRLEAQSQVGRGTAVSLLLPQAGRLPAKERER